MLTMVGFNVNSPSLDRAMRQLDWLEASGADVVVLSELKGGETTGAVIESLARSGFEVAAAEDAGKASYSAAIASRVPVTREVLPPSLTFARSRAVSVLVPTTTTPLRLLGVYGFPSDPAGTSPFQRVQEKRSWLASLLNCIRDFDSRIPTIIMGDINIVEPLKLPQYSAIKSFEADFYNDLLSMGYVDAIRRHAAPGPNQVSWRDHAGRGYRFDHFFCSASLADSLAECYLDHSPRELKPRLTDHSAIWARLDGLSPIARHQIDRELLDQPSKQPTLF